VVTICTAQWSLYVPHSGHYMYRTVVTICTTSSNTHNSTFCPHSCIYVFCVDLRTNSDYFNWMVFTTETKICLLRGSSWISEHNSRSFRPARLNMWSLFTKIISPTKQKHKTTLPNRGCAPHCSREFLLSNLQPPEAITDLQHSSNYCVYYYTKYINFRSFRLFCALVTATTSRVYTCACVHSKCRANRVAWTSLRVFQDERRQLVKLPVVWKYFNQCWLCLCCDTPTHTDTSDHTSALHNVARCAWTR